MSTLTTQTINATSILLNGEQLHVTGDIPALLLSLLPEWEQSLTYNELGDISEIIYSNSTKRIKTILNYSELGELTSVDYSFSEDSGTTWQVLGTETMNYTGEDLVGTSWAEAI